MSNHREPGLVSCCGLADPAGNEGGLVANGQIGLNGSFRVACLLQERRDEHIYGPRGKELMGGLLKHTDGW